MLLFVVCIDDLFVDLFVTAVAADTLLSTAGSFTTCGTV